MLNQKNLLRMLCQECFPTRIKKSAFVSYISCGNFKKKIEKNGELRKLAVNAFVRNVSPLELQIILPSDYIVCFFMARASAVELYLILQV